MVCQLLLSTLASSLFQVSMQDAGKMLSNMVLASLLSTWNIAITYMTDSIVCVFILNVQDYCIQLLRLVIILSYLEMPVNLVQYRGTVGVFNNCKFHNKMVANKFYSSQCGFNAELAVLAPFSIHQIILLLLTILMCRSKDNYVQSIKRLCISFIIITSIYSILPLQFYSILITLSGDVKTNPGPKRNSTETF